MTTYLYPFRSLLSASLQGVSRVNNLAQLLYAEEVLDDLADKGKTGTVEYQYLRQCAASYVKANPELLAASWLRSGGAVFDIIEEQREAALVALESEDLPDSDYPKLLVA